MKSPAEAMRRQKNAIVVRCFGFIVVLLITGRQLVGQPGRPEERNYEDFLRGETKIEEG